MLEDYVVVDLELTGLHVKTDRILEIGAVKVEHGVETEIFHRLINPGISLSAEITELTGITDEMAKGGCSGEDAVSAFLAFAEGYPFVGHNVLFDYRFLKRAAVNQGILLEKSGADTWKLSQKFLPEAEKKTLDYLCSYLKIPRAQSHRALEDAKATAELFRYLKERFGASEPEAFEAKPLACKVKKQTPASPRQIKRLIELAQWHNIELTLDLDQLTKSEASRLADKILSGAMG
ncbi:3'-5' exonuclease [Lachnospiraceae bacterium 29-84]